MEPTTSRISDDSRMSGLSSIPSVSGEQIHELIESRGFGELKSVLCGMDVHDLAELLGELDDEKELALAFRMLPTETAAEIMGELELEQQEELLGKLSRQEVADILNEMPPDDRTGLLEELPGQVAQKLMTQLRGDQLKVARSLLAYPEDSIGRLMTPEYVAVRDDWSIDHVLRHIRRVAESRETISVIYVVDTNWKLLDEIYLDQIVLADPDKTVADLMDNQAASLNAADDQEEALEAFKKYDAVALPVVDQAGTLVGIVTFDDVMDLQEEEDTEDMQKMAGMAALEDSYLSASFWQMIKKRLPWLVMLLVAETLAVVVLKGFDRLLVVLAMFMPLINATAGNTGSQVSALMIRSFAVNEISLSDWLGVLMRELGRGLTMGAMLALPAAAIVLIFPPENPPAGVDITLVPLAVGIAMVAAVTLANLIGAMLPFAFKRIGLDPAVTSGPFIACLMDVSSILIFFSLAAGVLKIAG